METQQLQTGNTPTRNPDPVTATLESLLRDEEMMPRSSRFAEVLRLAVQTRQELVNGPGDDSRTALAPYRLRQAKEYIEANFCSEIRLEEVAAAAGLSPSHFCRQFKLATGMSPLRYVLEMRIAHAKKLIVETETPLVDVALELGFSSQSHFTVIFHKIAGLPPRRYREHYRQ